MTATQSFTNSPLVCHVRLSPNHSGKRNMNIDMIAIHMVAGNCTIETVGEIFAPSSRGASSNYGVGSDGRIGMYVEEKNRSWCTSSGAIDNRAITIEVANDSKGPDWHVSDKALQSLINLCVDICKRNNIKKLMWQNSKSLQSQLRVDQQNIAIHEYVNGKNCPGPYLKSKLGYIAEEVNKRLGSTGSSSYVVDVPSTSVVSGSNEKIIWNFFKNKGLNNFATAGIMGNLYAESSLMPNNLQGSYEKKLGYNDDTYTKAVDNGSYKNFIKDSAGYGLAQWTYWTRKESLYNYAKKTNRSISDINMQLEFLWDEMQGYKSMMNSLNNSTSVWQSSTLFMTQFERPADQSDSAKNKRASYGDGFYKKNADSDKSNIPYLVKVNTTELNVRKGPGTDYSIGQVIYSGGVYTIVEESMGIGALKWGKLKSGAGWISLDYCIKVS